MSYVLGSPGCAKFYETKVVVPEYRYVYGLVKWLC